MQEDLTASLTDEARGLQFHYPSDALPVNPETGDKCQLLLQSFEGEDRLGRLFEYRIDLLSECMDVDFDLIVGKQVSVSMETSADVPVRYFNGYVTEFAFRGSEGRFGRFSATIRPWLWFLSRTSNCRIFQGKTTPEIIKEIFDGNGMTQYKNQLRANYQERDYCVQYRESDLDFVSRLMELDGIYYYFEHEEKKHTMVLVDDSAAHVANKGYEEVPYYPPTENDSLRIEEHLQDWMLRQTITPSEFSQRDYDFTKPKTDLTSKSKLLNTQKHDNPLSSSEVFDYPGDFSESGVGKQNSDVLSGTWETQGLRAYASGVARGMVAGCTFKLTDYPHEPQNQEYLVVSVHHQIYGDEAVSGGGGDREFYRCHIEAVKKNWPYRSQRITPRPMIRGPQTARVVGKKGEEIWCDEYGRVKVQFHWDRLGKSDENTTCWIRVSQLWAGKNWGGMHIPRIDQEVVVSFLEGDPDRPLITGSVYNAENMPPYELPEHQTRSGIQSRSTKEGKVDNFNELRFEDKEGKEEVYVQAEKDLNSVIKYKESRKIGASRTTDIGEGEHNPEAKPESVNVDVETTTIHASKKTEVKGNEVYEVATDGQATKGRNVTIKNGDESLVVSLGDISRKASAGNVKEEAAKSIEFKVGGSSIKMDPTSITIKALTIKIQADSMAEVTSPMTTVKGDGTLTLKGGMVMIN